MRVTFTSFIKDCIVQIVLNKVHFPHFIIKKTPKNRILNIRATFLKTMPHINTKFTNFKN